MNIDVNMRIANRLWADFCQSKLCNMASSMICNQVLKNGISFEKNSRIFTPSIDIEDAFQEYWHNFVQKAIKHIMCFGFAVVIIRKDSAKRLYPDIVQPHLYSISINTVNNEYSYNIESSYVDIKDVHIFTHFGTHPLPNGHIVSMASRVMPSIKFLERLRATTVIMEQNKSSPMYFSEVNDTNKERHEGVDFDFYAEAGAGDVDDSLKFERNKTNIEVLLKQQELYEQYLGRPTRRSTTLQNIAQLPSGQKVVPTSQNTGRQDIVQLHKIVQETICSGLGVPRSLMIGDSLYKSDTEGVSDSFKHTILWWRDVLQPMMTDLYQKMYINTNNVKVTNNIFLAKKRHQIKVIFPIHPYTTTEELHYLYKSGIIDWTSYSTYVLQNTSLPSHIRQKEPPQDLDEIDPPDKIVLNGKRKRSST